MNLNNNGNNTNFNDYINGNMQNENMQNEYTSYSPRYNGVKKTKGIKLWVLLLIILIILTLSGVVVAMVFTDAFKSDKALFMEYANKNIIQIKEIFKPIISNENLVMNKYREKISVDIDFIQEIGTSEENSDNVINDLELSVLSEIDKQNNYGYSNIKLEKKDEKVSVEYVKNQDGEYITMNEILEGYVKFDEEFKNKFNLNSFDEIISIFDTNNNDIINILMSYYKIINTNLTDDNFSKVKNQKINVNNQDIVVDGYTLSLTEEQIYNLVIKVLEQLKVDENIQFENEEQKNKFHEMIENIISEYSDVEFDTENLIVYTMFEKDDKIVSSSIKNNSFSAVFEMYEEEGRVLDISLTDFETEEKYNVVIKSTNENINVEIPLDDNQTLILDYSNIKEDNIINKDFNVKYETQNESVKLDIKRTIEENADIELKEILEEDIIKVNDNKNTEIMNKIVGIFEENKSGEMVLEEADKIKFNAEFEILKGTDLESDTVIQYMEEIKKSVIDYEVISNKVLRLKIDIQNSNEEKYMTIYNMIEKNDENKYNIELEYDDETGLVNGLLLTII